MIKAEYILPQVRPGSIKCDIRSGTIAAIQLIPVEPDELPRTLVEYGDREVMAYLAWQMPFAYGCVERIFADLGRRLPGFRPASIFDFGVGPGTAILVAEQIWPGSLKKVYGVDTSEPMLVMAGRLLAEIQRSLENPIETIQFKRFLSLSGRPQSFDLTTAAFSLGDLPDDGVRRMTVDALWEQTKDVLVLVERGTPEGSRIIANARRQILAKEGYLSEDGETLDPLHRKSELHIVAPCPHEKRCPMLGSWCHFSQRIEATRFQLEMQKIPPGFVDQKFSYLVLRRGPRPVLREEATLQERSFHWPRLIRRPIKRAGHIINDYCDVDSTFKRVIVPRSQGKEVFFDARKSKWGDLWPHPPKSASRPIDTLFVKRGSRSAKRRGSQTPKTASLREDGSELDEHFFDEFRDP